MHTTCLLIHLCNGPFIFSFRLAYFVFSKQVLFIFLFAHFWAKHKCRCVCLCTKLHPKLHQWPLILVKPTTTPTPTKLAQTCFGQIPNQASNFHFTHTNTVVTYTHTLKYDLCCTENACEGQPVWLIAVCICSHVNGSPNTTNAISCLLLCVRHAVCQKYIYIFFVNFLCFNCTFGT